MRSTPQETAERALELSKADGCVVIADESSNANLRWANNELTTNGIARGTRLTVTAVVNDGSGTSAGVVSHGGVSNGSVEELVRAAEEAARSNARAEDAQPLVAAGSGSPRWDEPPAEASVEMLAGFVPSLDAALERARGQGRELFGYARQTSRSTYLASSSGARLRHDQSSGHVEMTARAAGGSASAWAGSAGADLSDMDAVAMDAQLAERLGWAGRRVELPAGRYETLLPPAAVADLMACLYESAGAREAHDGRSVFARPGGGTRVGERLTGMPLTLRSYPSEPGLECAPFVVARASDGALSVFDNGLPLGPTSWISDGRLSALLQTRHSAGLTGLEVTPQIDNLVMEGPPGGGTLADMVAGTGRGLLLTCLWYLREVDPQTLLLTGLTRDGVYLVEDGEVVGEVNNFRFNESPVGLLERVAEAGVTERTLPREWGDAFERSAMPALRVADFNMSSVSEAT